MNNAAFGSLGACKALEEASLKLEVGLDWCAGGDECHPWKESKEGKERYKVLKERFMAQQG
jgi:hypothetical protein